MKEERISAPAWNSAFMRALKQIGPVRLAATILFLIAGLLFARFGWSIPLAVDAERALFDIRLVETAPRVDQDPRIAMVVFTDETLEATAKRSPLDRKMLADALTQIDAMNPKAIGIDILIDQAQPEDQYLIDAFRRMKTPTYLAFASNATNPDYIRVWQEEFLRNFLKQVESGPIEPTSILLQPDPDGVIRSWPPQPRQLPPLLANSLAPIHPEFRDYQGSIAFRLPKSEEYPVFSSMPIDIFATELAPAMREQIEGRYVLIGGDIQDFDDFETPMTKVSGKLTKGLEVHAHLLAQLLDGRMPAPLPGWALCIAALGVVAAGALTSLLEMKSWRLALVLIFQVVFFLALPFYLQSISVDTQGLPAFGWVAGWILAFSAVGTAARAVGSAQRRFAQSALGKYLPRDIAAQIMRDPERLPPRGAKR